MEVTDVETERLAQHSLVRECVAGSEKHRDQFVREFDRLLAFAALTVRNRRGANHVEVDELKQYLYLKLFEDDCRRLRLWRGDAKLSTYLVQVSRNLCVDFLRKQARQDQTGCVLDENTADAASHTLIDDAPTDDVGRVQALHLAIEGLNSRQKLIVTLRLKGKSLRDIADILNTPPGTIFVENSRALAKLANALSPVGSK